MKHAKNAGRHGGPNDRQQRRQPPRNKESRNNDNDEEQALIFNEHVESNGDEQSIDVMNVTFNRSSATTHNLFVAAQSPKPSEYPDDFFSVEKKDSLKLSTGEYEAFDLIKENKHTNTEASQKSAKPEKKRKKRNQML